MRRLGALGTLGIGVASAVAVLWATSGTQRERPLLTGEAPELVRACEAAAAARPDDPATVRALAQAYLDAQQSGLALALLEAAPPLDAGRRAHPAPSSPRAARPGPKRRRAGGRDARGGVVYAHRERAAVTGVGSRRSAGEGSGGAMAPAAAAGSRGATDGCDAVLLASAVRRARSCEELVALGVEDTRAHPEESFVAYQNATREARVSDVLRRGAAISRLRAARPRSARDDGRGPCLAPGISLCARRIRR